MGLFDNKNKKTEAKNILGLAQAAELYNTEPNDTNFLAVLAVLKQSNPWIPLMETEYGVMPYTLEAEDGTQYLPIFSDVYQIPDEYAESLAWSQVTFASAAQYVMDSTQVGSMLLNAFSKSVVISEESIRVLMNENSSEHAVNSADLKLISAEDDGEAAEIKRKAYAFFYNRKDVKKAYFAKLLNGGETSYIFVVEIEGNSREMFKALFEAIGNGDISMPIDYTVYPSLKEQLEAIDCKPFFVS